MRWFALFLAVGLASAAFRVSIAVRVVRARRAGDTDREARLASLAFRTRVGFLGLVLVVLIGLVVVGVLTR